MVLQSKKKVICKDIFKSDFMVPYDLPIINIDFDHSGC